MPKVQAFAMEKLRLTPDRLHYDLMKGLLYDLDRFRELARESSNPRLKAPAGCSQSLGVTEFLGLCC